MKINLFNVITGIDLNLNDLTSKDLSREKTEIRHIFVYFLKKYFKLSNAEIMDFMGYKNHSSVIYAIKKITDKAEIYKDVRTKIQAIDLISLSSNF